MKKDQTLIINILLLTISNIFCGNELSNPQASEKYCHNPYAPVMFSAPVPPTYLEAVTTLDASVLPTYSEAVTTPDTPVLSSASALSSASVISSDSEPGTISLARYRELRNRGSYSPPLVVEEEQSDQELFREVMLDEAMQELSYGCQLRQEAYYVKQLLMQRDRLDQALQTVLCFGWMNSFIIKENQECKKQHKESQSEGWKQELQQVKDKWKQEYDSLKEAVVAYRQMPNTHYVRVRDQRLQ